MKKFFHPFIPLLAGFCICLFFSCTENTESADNIDYTDKGNDINNYKTVTIGTQVWMAENLNYDVAGSVCLVNCATYGRLYDWETAMTVCPEGWHLPSKTDLEVLTNYIKSDNRCFMCDAKHLKTTSGWKEDGNGLDSYDFSALPIIDSTEALWWSSEEYSMLASYSFVMSYDDDIALLYYFDKESLLSVRCIKD